MRASKANDLIISVTTYGIFFSMLGLAFAYQAVYGGLNAPLVRRLGPASNEPIFLPILVSELVVTACLSTFIGVMFWKRLHSVGNLKRSYFMAFLLFGLIPIFGFFVSVNSFVYGLHLGDLPSAHAGLYTWMNGTAELLYLLVHQ